MCTNVGMPTCIYVFFDVEVAPCVGRPVEANEDTIKALFEFDHSFLHLKHLDIWVPQVLTETNF